MKWSELILLAGLVAFSGVLQKDSLALDYNSGGGFGPGFIPLNFAIVTILLAGVIGTQSFLRSKARDPEDNDAEPATWFASLAAPLGTIALLFVATFFMEFGSVLLPLAVVTTVVSTVFLKHGLAKAAGLTVVTLAVIYAIFSLWLNIPVI
ncbi:MAG: tripartite tricarboxylate transporter TctB family protein [Pseudomonadota bacterium]